MSVYYGYFAWLGNETFFALKKKKYCICRTAAKKLYLVVLWLSLKIEPLAPCLTAAASF